MVIKLVSDHLQDTTKAIHGINIKKKLKKWTLDFIRAWNCILLGEGVYDGPFIKIYLHWKLDTSFFSAFLHAFGVLQSARCRNYCVDARETIHKIKHSPKLRTGVLRIIEV